GTDKTRLDQLEKTKNPPNNKKNETKSSAHHTSADQQQQELATYRKQFLKPDYSGQENQGSAEDKYLKLFHQLSQPQKEAEYGQLINISRNTDDDPKTRENAIYLIARISGSLDSDISNEVSAATLNKCENVMTNIEGNEKEPWNIRNAAGDAVTRIKEGKD